MTRTGDAPHPHGDESPLMAGAPLEQATGAIVALHGRGASAEDIIALAREVAPPGVTILAPQAAGNTWYPYRFTEPRERNEPFLSSALRTVTDLVTRLGEQGISPERTALLGFSQGACLALEAAARNPRRYAAVVAFTGGLIGPPGMPFDFDGSLQGTPVFIGSSDVDPHVPLERVDESAEALERLGAAVEARIYPGMGHTVNRDELEVAREILDKAFVPTTS
jgi:phospholipase/carboxylesterase